MAETFNSDGPTAPMPEDAVVRAVARAHERDRYLAALLAPAGVRGDLLALAAFAGELARIPASVSEPIVGEMRLQWWRDTLDAGLATPPGGDAPGHPVARAIIAAARRRALPIDALLAVIDAQSGRLEDQPFADQTALETNVRCWDGGLFDLAWMIVEGVHRQGPPPALLGDSGVVYGIARILAEASIDRMHGRILVPKVLGAASGARADLVDTAVDAVAWRAALDATADDTEQRFSRLRASYQVASPAVRLAALPIALVRPYLGLSRRVDMTVANGFDIGPLTRVWRLWAGHRLPRWVL